jgi:quercetin dioxygenase-like cupin family protein
MEPKMPTATSAPIDLGPITVTFSVEADQSNGTVTVSRCDVAAGAGVPLAHSHDGFEETIHGISGTSTWTLDGEDVEVGAGDTICIRRGVVHSFMASGGDTSFLAIATPGVFGPQYFHDIADVIAAAAGGPPDMAAVADVMRRHGLTPVLPPATS